MLCIRFANHADQMPYSPYTYALNEIHPAVELSTILNTVCRADTRR
jgi:hypothetical protein